MPQRAGRVFNEYVTDTADAARTHDLDSIVVSNGFIPQAPVKKLCQHVDAIKIGSP
jgi:pyruvate-formate lyase-activating enzyme